MQRISERIDVDCVPKDAVWSGSLMSSACVYPHDACERARSSKWRSHNESAITKLQQRVVLLEQRASGPSNQSAEMGQPHGPSDNNVTGSLPVIAAPQQRKGGKAVPRIGRVMPASRAMNMR